MNASSKPDKLPTAARQPACYRRSAAWRAAVDNSARCYVLRPKRLSACALNCCVADHGNLSITPLLRNAQQDHQHGKK